MILVRAPLRVSFVGGGSDVPAYYRRGEPGHVVSLAIQESVYVTVQPSHDGRTRLHYRQVEDVASPRDLRHDRARACLGVREGVEVHSIADVPAGSGMGSSSAFTVALLHALDVSRSVQYTAEGLAEAACAVEIDVCGHPIGKQDQYASALGGLRHYTFHPDESVTHRPLYLGASGWRGLAQRLWLIPVGGAHDAGHLLREQATAEGAEVRLHAMATLAATFAEQLEAGDLDACGEILDQAWQLKRRQPGVTAPHIDDTVRRAKAAGALGCKLLGAGGAGFVLAWLKVDRADVFRQAFPSARPVRPCHTGAHVVYRTEEAPALPPILASRYQGMPL